MLTQLYPEGIGRIYGLGWGDRGGSVNVRELKIRVGAWERWDYGNKRLGELDGGMKETVPSADPALSWKNGGFRGGNGTVGARNWEVGERDKDEGSWSSEN